MRCTGNERKPEDCVFQYTPVPSCRRGEVTVQCSAGVFACDGDQLISCTLTSNSLINCVRGCPACGGCVWWVWLLCGCYVCIVFVVCWWVWCLLCVFMLCGCITHDHTHYYVQYLSVDCNVWYQPVYIPQAMVQC